MWARSMVTYPFSTRKVIKSSMKPMAVTISGFIMGRLLTCSTRSRTIFLDLLNPMAEMVPTTVEIRVAISATLKVVYSASIISRDSSMCRYQRREKPVKLVRDFPSLKENTIIYKIGR